MAPSHADVAARSAVLADVARTGGEWLADNGEAMRLDREGLAQAFRRFSRRARRLQVAVERPTAVAVFGASQAGKSYLVSSLAAPRNKPLVAAWGEERLDFLRDLNPEGGKESTGLVSRFTIRRMPTPAGAPVPLLLLTQTDVVKILANTFLEDIQSPDLVPPSAEDIDKLFNKLEAEAGTAPCDRLTIDDVEELREYFDHYFRGREMIRALAGSYWTRAARIIPRLPAHRRAEAYSPLWNFHPVFTQVLGEMIAALGKLGFPDYAFCDTNALRRDGGNLLDAATVLFLGMGPQGDIKVATSAGASAMLDRTVLTSLIAEVTVPVGEKPWDFFDHTDLLDFPGARTRNMYDSIDRAVADKDGVGGLGGLFLRGKVAYLFQRYNAEQEISAMLLCIGDSVQEVKTLPYMINGWVEQTIGATPQQRAQQRNSLYLVLTKFDKELDGKRGEDPTTGQRWTNRLTASVLEPFGQFEWMHNWAPGKPFNNTYWLRSKAVPCQNVFNYDQDGMETLAPPTAPGEALRGAEFLDVRYKPYLANEIVRRHFSDPERAWQAVMTPNDGGITHLADALRPVCDPVLKQEQINGRLQELARDIDLQLRPHFHTGDMAAELERARGLARELLRALLGTMQAQMFGLLLRSLQVTEDQVTDIYWRQQSEDAETPLQLGAASEAQSYFDDLPDFLRSPGMALQAPAARDRFDQLAELMIAEWTRAMQAFAEDPQTETEFRLPREQITLLVGEITRAARRIDLRGSITRELHARAAYQGRAAQAMHKPVIIIEQAINGFVQWLGFDREPVEKRPKTGNGTPIFSPRPQVQAMPELGPMPTPYDRNFHIDWMTAIAAAMEANVRDTSSGELNIEQNARLGGILKQLEGAL